MKKEKAILVCPWCKESFTQGRKDQEFCRPKCRTANRHEANRRAIAAFKGAGN